MCSSFVLFSSRLLRFLAWESEWVLHRQHKAVISSALPQNPKSIPDPFAAGKASVFSPLQPLDFSLLFCCPIGYSPGLLPTARFAFHLHLFLLNCILLLSNHCSAVEITLSWTPESLQPLCPRRTRLPSALPAVIYKGQVQNWLVLSFPGKPLEPSFLR